MGNMSYCRFENTVSDLRDCLRALEEGDDEELSRSEKAAKEELIELCEKIADVYGREAE